MALLLLTSNFDRIPDRDQMSCLQQSGATSTSTNDMVNASRFPCCVLLALSWNTTTNENPSTDKLSRANNLWFLSLQETSSQFLGGHVFIVCCRSYLMQTLGIKKINPDDQLPSSLCMQEARLQSPQFPSWWFPYLSTLWLSKDQIYTFCDIQISDKNSASIKRANYLI